MADCAMYQIFDAIAAECAANEIYVHLDNHISQGTWCCSTTDGNAWWGDTYFSISNWTRGLAYMADHVRPFCHLLLHSVAAQESLTVF